MPFCRNCGAKLDEGARFCRVCGTAVTPVSEVIEPRRSLSTRRPAVQKATLPIWAIALIIILVVAFVALAVAFLPYQPVSFSQANEASESNVDSLSLSINAEVANVNVILIDLPGNQRVATNISATGWRGLFGEDRPLALSFNETTSGSTLVYSVGISRAGGWLASNPLTVVCDVYVDPSVDLGITVRTNVGAITMDAKREATFSPLLLQATTGDVVVRIRDSTTFNGGVSLGTTTGTVEFSWENAKVTHDIPLDLKTTTGSVIVNVTQNRQLAGNVTLNAEVTTGGVNFAMAIQNDVGAKIAASTVLGGIDVVQTGFSGNNVPLQSSNYPGGSNFNVTLKTTTGGVNINADYDLGGTRS